MLNHIQSLRDELSKEHPRRAVLWTVHDKRGLPTDAVETQYLNLDKPCVIFFGGGAYTSIGNDAVIPQYRAIKDMLSPEINSTDYEFYTFTDEGSIEDKGKGLEHVKRKNLAYNNFPRNFYSKKAETFVETFLLSYAPDHPKDVAQSDALVHEIAKRFSKITFMGYSYGGAFVQEIRNALDEKLSERGYSIQEKVKIIGALASVNTAPSFKYTSKFPDITQATFVLAADKDALRASKIFPENPDLEFSNALKPVAFAESGSHYLIYGKEGSTRVRRISYGEPSSNLSLDQLRDMAVNWQTANDEPAKIDNEVVRPHHARLYSASLRWGINDDGIQYVFPSNLIGLNAPRFLCELVKGSRDAAEKDSVRDAPAIIKHSIATYLTPKQMETDAVRVQFFQQMFDKLTSDAKGR